MIIESFVNLISYIFRAVDMQGYNYYKETALVNLYKIIILTCFNYCYKPSSYTLLLMVLLKDI